MPESKELWFEAVAGTTSGKPRADHPGPPKCVTRRVRASRGRHRRRRARCGGPTSPLPRVGKGRSGAQSNACHSRRWWTLLFKRHRAAASWFCMTCSGAPRWCSSSIGLLHPACAYCCGRPHSGRSCELVFPATALVRRASLLQLEVVSPAQLGAQQLDLSRRSRHGY